MTLYRVVIERTEMIEFTLDADGPEDAADRALMDGDETGAKTTSTRLVSASPVVGS